MNMRCFFLKQDGWFEAEVTENLKDASPDELARWVYAMADRHKFRNYLITENPGPVFGKQYSVVGDRYSITDVGYLILDAGC
jgi:hypothetical protein